MVNTIWKYPIEDYNLLGEMHKIEMPFPAEVLHVGESEGKPCVWAIVDPDNPSIEIRRFRVFGTGFKIKGESFERQTYLGTVHLKERGGNIVLHIFGVR